MKDKDFMKRFREVKFTTEHTLSKEQFKQLIRDKMERAERQYRAKKVQEERTLQP